jgi:hypothetical protein
MKTCFATLVCALAFSCFSTGAHAESAPAAAKLDPALLQDARRLMDAIKFRELTMLSMQQTEELIPAQIDALVQNMVQNDATLSAEQKQRAMEHIGELKQAFAAQVHGLFADPALVDEMVAELEPVYAQAYTREEMRKLTAFYRSPLGQKMLASMPKLMVAGMGVSNRLTLPRMEKLVRKMVETLNEKYPQSGQ